MYNGYYVLAEAVGFYAFTYRPFLEKFPHKSESSPRVRWPLAGGGAPMERHQESTWDMRRCMS